MVPTELESLDPTGAAELFLQPEFDFETQTEVWTLDQSGRPVGGLLTTADGSRITTSTGQWAINRRMGRAGWWAEFVPSAAGQGSLRVTPWAVRPGGAFDWDSQRFTLRLGLLGERWKLADDSRRTVARLRMVKRREQRHMEIRLGDGAPDSRRLALLLIAASWLVIRQPTGSVGGDGAGTGP